MDRSTLAKILIGVAIAIFLGFIGGRQQQIADNQVEILRQIRELRTPPTDPEKPVDLKLNIAGAAAKGNENAGLTLIEFSDFECPFCARYFRDTQPQLERDYISTGKVRHVFRHFPLTEVHPHAVKAAEAAECARLQGKFWELHDLLFANQKLLDTPSLLNHARASGLDMKAFEPCLNGQATVTVRSDLDFGTRNGISATPTFFLGFAQKDGSVHVVEQIVGAKPYAEFQSVLDRLLAQAGAQQ